MKLHIHTGAKGLRAFSHDRTVTITIPRKRKQVRDTQQAAGVAYFNEEGAVLLCKRSDGLGWSFPAGGQEPGETPAETARREFKEETGRELPSLADAPSTTLGSFTVFLYQGSQFEPVLCDEHEAHDWFDPEKLPEGTHKGVKEELEALGLEQLAHKLTDRVQDAEFDESDHPRDADGKFSANGGSASKPTKATAKGSKAGVHELLKSGHAFTVEELMKATGTTNRSTIMTALSDLKSPKYAGALGHLSITKRSDGTYHVTKEEGGAMMAAARATSEAPAVKQDVTEPTVLRVTRDPIEGTLHWVKIPGDDREFPIVRSDSRFGLGYEWTPGAAGAWDDFLAGPAQSQNTYISQHLGYTREEALGNIEKLVKRMDESPHYNAKLKHEYHRPNQEAKTLKPLDEAAEKIEDRELRYAIQDVIDDARINANDTIDVEKAAKGNEWDSIFRGSIETLLSDGKSPEVRAFFEKHMAPPAAAKSEPVRARVQEPTSESEPYTGPAYHMIESDDEFTHHVVRYPDKKRQSTHSFMERAHRVREELDKTALKEHVEKLGREQTAAKLEWKKHDWMNSSHATLPAGHKASRSDYSNGDVGYTIQGGDSVYKHYIRTDADGNVQYHRLETPHTSQGLRGQQVQSTSQKGLNPAQAARFAGIYKELGLIPWHKQKKP